MPVPLSELDTRLREHGRIRIGKRIPNPHRPGQTMPTSISMFRFTSPDKVAIETLAGLYGGVVEVWTEPKASPPNQWQVETLADTIDIWLPAGSLSQWYELHGGGGLERRCDGVTVTVPMQEPDGIVYKTGPCICNRVQREECKTVTRLNVVLPNVVFGGQWRLETKGWNAAKELPGIVEMIELLQPGKIIPAKLTVERRTKMVKGKTKSFVVPGIYPNVSPAELIAGAATIAHVQLGPGGEVLALEAAVPDPPVEVEVETGDIVVEDLTSLCDELTWKVAGLGAGADLLRMLIATIKPGAWAIGDIDDIEYDRLVAIVKACLAGEATIKLKPGGTVAVSKVAS